MKSLNPLLLIAGLLSFGVAVFQTVISFVPEWSEDFDAGDTLISNPPLLLTSGLVMAAVFVLFGLYGLSGAGVIRRLPLLSLALFVIGAVYTLRGLAFAPQALVVFGFLPSPQAVTLAHLMASLVALIAGMLYLAGLAIGWESVSKPQRKSVPISSSPLR